VVGEVIGVGIFLTPGEMAAGLGSPFWMLVTWLLVGATCVCGALCYGELAARFPDAGGGYVYLREAWGPEMAFLYGWKSLLVMDPGLTAALAAGLAAQAVQIWPGAAGREALLGIAVVLALAAINAAGVGLASGFLQLVTVAKLALLALLVVGGFLSGRGDWGHFVPFVVRPSAAPPLVAGLAGGTLAAFFCFAGFWDVVKLGGEVREPERTLPRALVVGIGVVTLVYVMTSAVFLYLQPAGPAPGSASALGGLGEQLAGPVGKAALPLIVIVLVTGSLGAVMMAAPRVYYAMARDGVFLGSVGRVHPRFGTPLRAIVVQAVLASALLAVGSFGQILGYFMFVTLCFVALTVAGLYRLPRPAAGGYRVPGYPWTPAGFLALLGVELALLLAGGTAQAAVGCLVVALGVPVYRFVAAPLAGGRTTKEA
jgi:APA family basic amino acid/polyamine antiporter